MKVRYLDHILDSIIKEFLSISHEEWMKEFKDRYPDYKYDYGFENAIKDWSNNKIRKEKSICRIIDLIEDNIKKQKKIDENMDKITVITNDHNTQ